MRLFVGADELSYAKRGVRVDEAIGTGQAEFIRDFDPLKPFARSDFLFLDDGGPLAEFGLPHQFKGFLPRLGNLNSSGHVCARRCEVPRPHGAKRHDKKDGADIRFIDHLKSLALFALRIKPV